MIYYTQFHMNVSRRAEFYMNSAITIIQSFYHTLNDEVSKIPV